MLGSGCRGSLTALHPLARGKLIRSSPCRQPPRCLLAVTPSFNIFQLHLGIGRPVICSGLREGSRCVVGLELPPLLARWASATLGLLAVLESAISEWLLLPHLHSVFAFRGLCWR